MFHTADAATLTATVAFLSFGISIVIGMKAMAIGTLLKVLDHPDGHGGRKLHARVTPLVGGIPVLSATLLASGAMLLWPGADPQLQSFLVWFLGAVLAMFVVGFSDDRVELPAGLRLLIVTVIFGLVATSAEGFRIDYLRFAGQDSHMQLLPVWAWLFTLLCLVGFLNAVNMADGKNGLVIGQAFIWVLILLFRMPSAFAPLLISIAIALAVMFLFNMRGRLFLGDSGSYVVSAVIGLLAIKCWNMGSSRMNADDLALIFAIPVFDTLRLMVLRTLKGLTPFTPGRDHLHHYLYARWGWPKPLPWVLLLVAVPNAAALLNPGSGLFWLAVTFLGYLFLLRLARQPVRATAAN